VIDIAAEHRSTLGEGPLWDCRIERLLWVDIVKGAVNILTASAESTGRIELGENVGCLVHRPHLSSGRQRLSLLERHRMVS
jgi:sugar lactone lactonase YvrE